MEVQQKPFTKKRPVQLVYLELGSGNGGMLTSVSEEGFRFRAVSPVRPAVQMPFAFSLDGSLHLEGTGVVEDLEDDCKSGGMRFTEVSEQFRTSLNAWLHSDSSSQSAGREFTPAASVPLDTMEKIRQDLRAVYATPPQSPEPAMPSGRTAASSVLESKSGKPNRPTEPAEPFLPTTAVSSAPTRKALKPPVSSSVAPQQTWPKPVVAPVPDTPATNESASTTTPAQPEPNDIQAVRRFFSAPLPADPAPQRPLQQPTNPPDPAEKPQQKPVEIMSAFLKPPPIEHRPFMPIRAVLNEPPATTEIPADTATRPYIPPLEESFEQAWESAKLTTPPETAHFSRAAAGGILALALAVILGALAYNFRQEIGTAFISFGRSISGDNQAAPQSTPDADPAAQPAENSGAPAEKSQGLVSAPAQVDSGTKAPALKPGATAQPDGGSASAKAALSPPAMKPVETSPEKTAKSELPPSPSVSKQSLSASSSTALENAAKPAVEIESPTGESEFKAAREMLRGPNRNQDLRRAVDLLWAAVRKGYVPAEVTLADLYRRGDGVEKNCDQATVLLAAASKKGSADARRMLELMAEQGCQ